MGEIESEKLHIKVGWKLLWQYNQRKRTNKPNEEKRLYLEHDVYLSKEFYHSNNYNWDRLTADCIYSNHGHGAYAPCMVNIRICSPVVVPLEGIGTSFPSPFNQTHPCQEAWIVVQVEIRLCISLWKWESPWASLHSSVSHID